MAESAHTLASHWRDWSLRFRQSFSSRRPSSVTAIDLDGSTLRVVQSVLRGNRSVVTQVLAGSLELASDTDHQNPEMLGAALAGSLEKLRIRPGAVVMNVPRSLAVLRFLSLPDSEDVRELASMVHFQLGKDLPFRLEEAAVDFRIRRSPALVGRGAGPSPPQKTPLPDKKESPETSEKVEILAAAVKRETVDFYQKTAAAAGLKLAGLGWQPCSNARCIDAFGSSVGPGNVALVTLRAGEVGVDIVSRGWLHFSRGALLPTPHPPDGSPSLVEATTIEVVRSLHGYGGVEQNAPISELVVSGGTGFEQAVVESLKTRLNLPCRVLDLAKGLNLPEGSGGNAAGSVSTVGMALGAGDADGLPIDFLNPKKPAVQRDLRRIRIIGGIAVATTLLVALLVVRSHRVNQRMKIFRQGQAALAAAEKKRPIYRQMRQQAATLQEWLKESRNWLDHYAYLGAVLPGSEEIYVKSIAVSQRGIRMAVQARSGEILARLDKQLRAAGYDVKPLAITPGADKYGYNFRSTVELSVPEKMQIDLAKAEAPSRPADDGSLDAPARGRSEAPKAVPAVSKSETPEAEKPKPKPQLAPAAQGPPIQIAPGTAPDNSITPSARGRRGGSPDGSGRRRRGGAP